MSGTPLRFAQVADGQFKVTETRRRIEKGQPARDVNGGLEARCGPLLTAQGRRIAA
jgi:hypothetical protein